MVRLTRERRALLADKLADVANVVLASTVFGPIVSGQPFSQRLLVDGAVGWLVLMTVPYLIAGGESWE
jgi:hypothetical protein